MQQLNETYLQLSKKLSHEGSMLYNARNELRKNQTCWNEQNHLNSAAVDKFHQALACKVLVLGNNSSELVADSRRLIMASDVKNLNSINDLRPLENCAENAISTLESQGTKKVLLGHLYQQLRDIQQQCALLYDKNQVGYSIFSKKAIDTGKRAISIYEQANMPLATSLATRALSNVYQKLDMDSTAQKLWRKADRLDKKLKNSETWDQAGGPKCSPKLKKKNKTRLWF